MSILLVSYHVIYQITDKPNNIDIIRNMFSRKNIQWSIMDKIGIGFLDIMLLSYKLISSQFTLACNEKYFINGILRAHFQINTY